MASPLKGPVKIYAHASPAGGQHGHVLRLLLRAALLYLSILFAGACAVSFAFQQLPPVAEVAHAAGVAEESLTLSVPRSFDKLRAVQRTVEMYRRHSLPEVLTMYSAIFLTMQCCFIPGSFFFAILGGSLQPLLPATALVTLLTGVGCSVNFFAARLVFARALHRFFPDAVRRFRMLVAARRSALAACLLFLRVVPMMPSWLLNCIAPLARVPYPTFLATTVLGFQPQFFVLLSAGRTIQQLHSWRDLYRWHTIAGIIVAAALSLVPLLFNPILPAGNDGLAQQLDSPRSGQSTTLLAAPDQPRRLDRSGLLPPPPSIHRPPRSPTGAVNSDDL